MARVRGLNAALARHGSAPIATRRASLAELLKRPELDWRAVEEIAAAGGLAASEASPTALELTHLGLAERRKTAALGEPYA